MHLKYMHLKGCTINCQQWLNLKGVIRELSFPLESVNILQILYQLKCMNAAAAAKSLQSCPTLCNSTGSSLPGSSVPGILQARILEKWVAISFSNASMHAKSLQLCLTLCDAMESSPPGFSVHRIL